MVFIEYDPEADVLFVRLVHLDPGSVAGARALDDRRLVHVDERGTPLGVEFLGASAGLDLTGVPEAAAIAAAVRMFPRLTAV